MFYQWYFLNFYNYHGQQQLIIFFQQKTIN